MPRSTHYLLILPCSSQSFNNRVDSLTPTTPLDHTHWTCAVMQSAKQAGLQCFAPHLRQSPVALKAGRQNQREPDKVKNHENHDWHEACFADCVTGYAQWVWLSAKWLRYCGFTESCKIVFERVVRDCACASEIQIVLVSVAYVLYS